MRFFRRKQRLSLLSRALPFLDRWIAPVGTRFQRWAEPRLTRIERQLSRRQKIILVTIFCLIAGAYSTGTLVNALSDRPTLSPGYLTPTRITRPVELPRSDTILRRQRTSPTPDSLQNHSPKNK